MAAGVWGEKGRMPELPAGKAFCLCGLSIPERFPGGRPGRCPGRSLSFTASRPSTLFGRGVSPGKGSGY